KAKFDQGKLLDARRGLATLINSNSLSEADLKSAKQLIAQINATVLFSPKKFADDEFTEIKQVPPGGALQRIAMSHDVTSDLLMRINDIKDARRLQAGRISRFPRARSTPSSTKKPSPSSCGWAT